MIDFGIIAAGDGERLRKEGVYAPKPLVEIGGKPMIGRLLELMREAGDASVSVIINSKMPEVEEYIQNFMPLSDLKIRVVAKSTPSSLHTFYELLQVMKPTGKFVVTTVDTIFSSEAFLKYVEFFRNSPHGIDGVMGVSSFIDDEKPLYVETEGRHRIIDFKDTYDSNSKYVSAGVYGLQTAVFPVIQECISSGVSRMRNFQRKLIEKGLNLDAFDMGKVLDIDHIGDIEKANAFLKKEDAQTE